GFIPQPGIIGWLSTTGLIRVVLDGTARLLQDSQRIICGFREKLIYKTWNKQINLHVSPFFHLSIPMPCPVAAAHPDGYCPTAPHLLPVPMDFLPLWYRSGRDGPNFR